MSETSQPPPPPGGQFLVYQTEDGNLKLDVRFEGETADSVVKESLTTAVDGKTYATSVDYDSTQEIRLPEYRSTKPAVVEAEALGFASAVQESEQPPDQGGGSR